MRIDLSPGEWAGVVNTLTVTAIDMRHDAATLPIEEDESRDLREQADDLDRIAGVIREHLAADGRELPELEPGEPDTEVTCQHVLTAEDVARRPELVVGEICGESLWVNETLVDVRGRSSWTTDGEIFVGKSRDTWGLDIRIGCERGHDWQMPDVADWA